MKGHATEKTDGIDGKTSRAICDAVGEKLQQTLRPDFSGLPDHLRHLMDALRRRDTEAGGH